MEKSFIVGLVFLIALIMISFSGAVWAADLDWIRSMGMFRDRYFLITPEAHEALQELNSIFDKDVLMWVASMYDPETGGFYYARSAIGREGFAADIESTSQALSFLKSMGIFDSMPEDIRQRFITFFQSRQDPVTGYFYDPQFGSNVSNSKRSRNLSQAVGRLRDLNAEPLYPLPYSKERQVGQTDSFNLYGSLLLGGQTGIGIGGAADVSRTVNIPTLPEYLTSAEALRRWMESFDWENRPWNAGHNVSSARTEIIQVGLVDVVYEFIEEIQNPDTGLWGKGRTLEEVSAAMKLSGYYVDRPYPRAKKMVESTIYAIKNHTPTAIVHIRNPVDLITTAIIRGAVGYDPEIEALLRENMPLFITWAKESLLRFKQPDKAFSYHENGSSRTSQGAVVSLGWAEADMNGTMAGAHATINYFYQLLGLSRPKMSQYAEEFWDVIVNMEPHERVQTPVGLDDDFEDADEAMVSWITKGPGTAKIVTDPHDPENKVLQLQKTVKGSGSSVSKSFKTEPGAEKTRVSLKFMVSDFGSGGAFNLRFGSGSSASDRAFALMIAKRDGVSFISHRATEKGYGDRISTIAPNVWYQLDIEYKPAGKEDTELAVYLDGELMQVFNDYYHGGDASRLPIPDIRYVEFYVYVDAVATLYVDDIKITAE
ncbi:MAG: hypothetical protein GX162_01125 [Firmicutes bacterium]|jgi:hypothetical protein|nr:hypothetical protein [Bacillota bacterium]